MAAPMRKASRTRSMSRWIWWCTGSTTGSGKTLRGSRWTSAARSSRRPPAAAIPRRGLPAILISHPSEQEAMMSFRSILAGTGGYLPERIVTNDELSRTIDTSDSWIQERTGIRQRHFAARHETTTFMGVAAARGALAAAGATAADVDAILLATSTPD